MSRSLVMSVLAAAAFAAAADSEPLYEWSTSPLVELTDANFEATVVKDPTAVWVVEFYANWCGHCKQFAKGYEKAAVNLNGIVKFGAVDADTHKGTAAIYGVQGFPSIKIFQPESSRNPYTGKWYKEAVDYKGPRSARALVNALTAALPSHVIEVTDKNLAGFRANGSLPKAVLLTNKEETTPLFKALALRLNGRLLLGEARSTAKKTAKAFEVDLEGELPALLVLPTGDGVAPVKFSGELKPAAISAFLDEHAAAAPATDASAGGEAGAGSSLAEAVTADNVAAKVIGADPWLLFFGEAAGAEAVAESVYGQVKVGVADASLAKAYGMEKKHGGNGVAMLKYGTAAKAAKNAKAFGSSEEAIADAKKAALDSLPEDYVEKLNEKTMDMWMSQTLGDSSPLEHKAMCLLFSDKKEVPHMFRSVAMRFEGKLGFAMVPPSLGARFNVQKSPAVLIMYPAEAPAGAEEGQMQLQGMQFQPQQHGKFSFGNLANFVAAAANQLPKANAPTGDAADDAEKEKKRAERKAADPMPSKRDLGPLPELSQANFETACPQGAGLCAIALVDGSAANTNKEAHLEMLTALRQKRAGGPLSFSWVDATCHVDFVGAFGLSEMDLPTMIVISPSKKRWARSVGAFNAETLGAFGTGVATGRKRTDDIAEIPSLENIDCAALDWRVNTGLEPEEDDGMGDEIMAEIMAEEAKKAEEREAEALVAAAVEADGNAKEAQRFGDLSEIQKLEEALENCETGDLLCQARRDKEQKAIDKKKALAEKLKEIAAKKKKAKKKAAKKAKKAGGN